MGVYGEEPCGDKRDGGGCLAFDNRTSAPPRARLRLWVFRRDGIPHGRIVRCDGS